MELMFEIDSQFKLSSLRAKSSENYKKTEYQLSL